MLPTTTGPRPRRRPNAAWLGLLAGAVAVAAVVVILVLPEGGTDTDRGATSASSNPVAGLIAQMARPWPVIQQTSGRFPSINGNTRYGDAMLGYALVDSGIRMHNTRLIRSGLRGLNYAVPRAHLHSRDSVFEILAIAGAYNLARAHLPHEPLFARHRAQWAAYLRHVPLIRLPATTYFGNHWLIEAVEVLELERTDIRSPDRFAVLGGQRAYAARLAADLVNRRIPGMARAGAVPTSRGPAFLLSDPPDNPLVYQGLSFGFYARAIEMLGARATTPARETLVQVARASLLATGPDGDLGYFGRNQEEAWGLGATAYGAWVTARVHESPPAMDAQLLALAARCLERLRTAYGVSPMGLNITPAIAKDPRVGSKGVDHSAGGPSFGGLTQLLLEWGRDDAANPPPDASIPADQDMRAVLSRGESRFAVVRSGNLWYAIRATTSGKHPEDVRADFGLVALKRRTGGVWRDVLHHRPITRGGINSAGPVLATHGMTGLPSAPHMRLLPDGSVAMTAVWHGPPHPVKRVVAVLRDGTIVRALGFVPGRTYRTGVPLLYSPVRCGIRMTVQARAGDTIAYSVFLLPGQVQTGRFGVSDQVSRVTFNRPATLRLQPGYASAVEPRLVRARLFFTNLPAGPLRITTCAK